MNMTSPDITIFVHDNNIFLFKTGSCKDHFLDSKMVQKPEKTLTAKAVGREFVRQVILMNKLIYKL